MVTYNNDVLTPVDSIKYIQLPTHLKDKLAVTEILVINRFPDQELSDSLTIEDSLSYIHCSLTVETKVNIKETLRINLRSLVFNTSVDIDESLIIGRPINNDDAETKVNITESLIIVKETIENIIELSFTTDVAVGQSTSENTIRSLDFQTDVVVDMALVMYIYSGD